MIKQHRQLPLTLTLLIAGLGLAACGSKNVRTIDDSADYHEAKVLPPLKKNSTNRAVDIVSDNSAENSEIAEIAARARAQDPRTISTSQSQQGDAVRRILNPEVSIEKQRNGTVVLAIVADEESAWHYLRTQLGQSEVTVHSRNKLARRISIGCAEIDPQTSDSENAKSTKKSRWSIRRRAKDEAAHCTLVMSHSKSLATVVAYDRNGQVAGAEPSRRLFVQILNK